MRVICILRLLDYEPKFFPSFSIRVIFSISDIQSEEDFAEETDADHESDAEDSAPHAVRAALSITKVHSPLLLLLE